LYIVFNFIKKKKLKKYFIIDLNKNMLNIHFLILLSTLCITFSSAYQWKNAEIVGGGFIPGIIFSEAEKDLIYARTDIGGLYRMNKSTKRWENLLKWVGVVSS
jgi:hypothetical protein